MSPEARNGSSSKRMKEKKEKARKDLTTVSGFDII